MKVLVACEYSGVVRDAFLACGHDAISCDLLPTESAGPHHTGDVAEIINDGFDLMIAHPPCTYLTVTGNKWFKPEYADRFPDRPQQREDAVKFFMSLANSGIPKMCIENPIGIMSTRWRKPDQIVHPYFFGDAERKATCLWLTGLEVLAHNPLSHVAPAVVKYKNGKGTDSRWHMDTMALPAKERAKARSRTFPGVAKAMADQWGAL